MRSSFSRCSSSTTTTHAFRIAARASGMESKRMRSAVLLVRGPGATNCPSLSIPWYVLTTPEQVRASSASPSAGRCGLHVCRSPSSGASAMAGLQTLKLLLDHPSLSVTFLGGERGAGQRWGAVCPFLPFPTTRWSSRPIPIRIAEVADFAVAQAFPMVWPPGLPGPDRTGCAGGRSPPPISVTALWSSGARVLRPRGPGSEANGCRALPRCCVWIAGVAWSCHR